MPSKQGDRPAFEVKSVMGLIDPDATEGVPLPKVPAHNLFNVGERDTAITEPDRNARVGLIIMGYQSSSQVPPEHAAPPVASEVIEDAGGQAAIDPVGADPGEPRRQLPRTSTTSLPSK
jgi:hypothetical protein